MADKTIIAKFRRFQQRINGSTIEYGPTSYHYKMLDEIKKIETEMKNKTDHQLKQISQELYSKARHNVSLDDLLIESYSLICETALRVLKLHPFDVQVIGGIVIHQGELAEMQTGEGKTLSAVFPAYLNALTGKGVHILTFNDYLARRDAHWMGPIYRFLGLNVGYIQEGMSIEDRQQAYRADITYLTAKEAGFDFLRDSLCYKKENIVHRPFNFAIIDEGDSILIDEARIPLVITGASDSYIANTFHLAKIAKKLEKGMDFEFDEYARNIHLTDTGLKHIEKLLQYANLYAEENIELLTRLHCAIHAEFLLKRDIDYIIRNGKIELVDEFTGRIADKRRWPDGLQSALEAKENISIQSKGTILNSITLQHFLQLYPKICGMTATAQPAEKELREFYNLNIVVIPPNRPCIRVDHKDILFKTRAEKNKALLEEIIKVNRTGRPILVGTRSVEESDMLADALQQQGKKCEVLNAKRDEDEAKIIAQAGKLNAVTISTNMAGRGTDIQLGGLDETEKHAVMALGGLYVIGTNKHESLRIDNQLRGRAGRQGDPGSSRFFISFEDDLFVKYRINDLLPSGILANIQKGEIDHPMIRNEINRIQRIIEGQNLDIKKTLYQYSWLIEKQRRIIYERRADCLSNRSIPEFFKLKSPDRYNLYKSLSGDEKIIGICKMILLYTTDKYWSHYLAEIADIREGIHLVRFGGKEPYLEFQKVAVSIFDELLNELDDELIQTFNAIQTDSAEIDLEKQGIKAPSATWTYLINDNPFENLLGLQLIGNIGISVGAALLMTPLIALFTLLQKLSRKQKKHG